MEQYHSGLSTKTLSNDIGSTIEVLYGVKSPGNQVHDVLYIATETGSVVKLAVGKPQSVLTCLTLSSHPSLQNLCN